MHYWSQAKESSISQFPKCLLCLPSTRPFVLRLPPSQKPKEATGTGTSVTLTSHGARVRGSFMASKLNVGNSLWGSGAGRGGFLSGDSS